MCGAATLPLPRDENERLARRMWSRALAEPLRSNPPTP